MIGNRLVINVDFSRGIKIAKNEVNMLTWDVVCECEQYQLWYGGANRMSADFIQPPDGSR